MLKSIQYRRLLWLTLLLGLAYCGLGWRLVELQVLSSGKLRQNYDKRVAHQIVERPKRGDILDRDGATMASSVMECDIGAEPLCVVPYQAQVAAELAPLLDMGVAELIAKLTPVTNRTEVDGKIVEQVKKWVVLKRNVSFEKWVAIRDRMQQSDFGLDLKSLSREEGMHLNRLRRIGIRTDMERQTRDYPNKEVGAQVLGYVGNQQKDYSVGSVSELIGMSGVERSFDELLRGSPGYYRVYRDATRAEDDYLPPRDGMNLVLTVSRRVQEIIDHILAEYYLEMRPKGIFATVMEVDTGEVLAMGNAPLFDPTDRASFDMNRVRLRSLLDEIEPGSIFKAIAVAGALEDGVVTLDTPIDCMNGIMPVRGFKPLKDHHPYGILPVKEVITKSSNIGTAQIVGRHGHDRFYQWMKTFGVGEYTGVGLPEGDGTLAPRNKIYPGEFTRLPIGYRVQVTQLQMALIYSAIANGGKLMHPRIVKRVVDPTGRTIVEYPARVVRQIMSERVAEQMVEALQTVTEPGGTATEAALDNYSVAGKTGTAHKWNSAINSYDSDRYFASFVGFFPASEPKFCIAITVDEPNKRAGQSHFGGKAAGPIFRKIAEQLAFQFHIKPDRSPGQNGWISNEPEYADLELELLNQSMTLVPLESKKPSAPSIRASIR